MTAAKHIKSTRQSQNPHSVFRKLGYVFCTPFGISRGTRAVSMLILLFYRPKEFECKFMLPSAEKTSGKSKAGLGKWIHGS